LSLNRPHEWRNGPVTFFHGTVVRSLSSITRGIAPRYFKPRKDFGRGFYLTTSSRQAASWADWLADQSLGADEPAILAFTIDLDDLAKLDMLSFVRGDYEDEAYWSFVWHCREHDTDHGRLVNGGWYDVVMGPVAAFWRQRALYAGGDQVSFHTSRAIALLNSSAQRRVV
jgi:hypothetical protein